MRNSNGYPLLSPLERNVDENTLRKRRHDKASNQTPPRRALAKSWSFSEKFSKGASVRHLKLSTPARSYTGDRRGKERAQSRTLVKSISRINFPVFVFPFLCFTNPALTLPPSSNGPRSRTACSKLIFTSDTVHVKLFNAHSAIFGFNLGSSRQTTRDKDRASAGRLGGQAGEVRVEEDGKVFKVELAEETCKLSPRMSLFDNQAASWKRRGTRVKYVRGRARVQVSDVEPQRKGPKVLKPSVEEHGRVSGLETARWSGGDQEQGTRFGTRLERGPARIL